MAFDLQSEVVNGIARLRLAGELDAKSAPILIDALANLKNNSVKRLVFFVDRLTYISSSGLRAILFARQELHVPMYWIASTEPVTDTLQLASFDQIVRMRPVYDPTEIEAL